MNCPRCKRELSEGLYEDYSISRCAACGGIWVDGKALLGIIDKRKEIMPEEALEAARNWRSSVVPKKELDNELSCPSCKAELSRAVYGYDSGIIIDRCTTGCGVWLDKGELEALQAFDEIWDVKARKMFEEKGLERLFEEETEEEKELRGANSGILGRLADILFDFLN